MNDEIERHEGGENAVGRPIIQDAPPIAIAQPASTKRPESVAEGQWYAPDSGEAFGKTLVIVSLAQFLTRSYFPKDNDPNLIPDSKVPRCSSADAKFPITGESPPLRDQSGAEAYVDNCAACPYGHWRTDSKTKERITPLCSESINLFVVAYSADGGSRLGRMRFTRSGHKAAQQLMKSIDAQFPPKPMYETAIEATIAGPFTHKSGKGKFYEPRLRVIGSSEKYYDTARGAGAWKDQGRPAFAELLAQWPDLHERIKARFAQGDDAEPEYVVPF